MYILSFKIKSNISIHTHTHTHSLTHSLTHTHIHIGRLKSSHTKDLKKCYLMPPCLTLSITYESRVREGIQEWRNN